MKTKMQIEKILELIDYNDSLCISKTNGKFVVGVACFSSSVGVEIYQEAESEDLSNALDKIIKKLQ